MVHAANMAKRDANTGKFIKRESDGKIIKPEGSLLFYGRYTASAIEGACCFEVIMDGSVAKTDRLDPLKLADVQIQPFHSFTMLEIKFDP